MSRTLVHVVQDGFTCRTEKCVFLQDFMKEPKYAHFMSRMRQMFYLGTYSHFSSHPLNRDDARGYIYNNHICC